MVPLLPPGSSSQYSHIPIASTSKSTPQWWESSLDEVEREIEIYHLPRSQKEVSCHGIFWITVRFHVKSINYIHPPSWNLIVNFPQELPSHHNRKWTKFLKKRSSMVNLCRALGWTQRLPNKRDHWGRYPGREEGNFRRYISTSIAKEPL